MSNLWAAQWRSYNRKDGESRHLIHKDCLPKIFKTRRECRQYITVRYGYIKGRPDLRREPHGWRMPRPVKVCIVITK